MFAFEYFFGGDDQQGDCFEDSSGGDVQFGENPASFAFDPFDFDQCGRCEFHVAGWLVKGAAGEWKLGEWPGMLVNLRRKSRSGE